MRVLAVDPGLTRCGVGVVEGLPGRRLALVEVGVIRTPSGDPTPRRLVAIEDELRRWFDRHHPEAIAIERVFADTNVSTVVGTAQVTGVVMLLAERRGLPVTMHTPTEVKAAVSGSGRAGKAQVTAMVTRLLGLASPPRPADAADALALAICHVWRGGTQLRLAEAAARAASRTAAARTPAGTGARTPARESTRAAPGSPPGGIPQAVPRGASPAPSRRVGAAVHRPAARVNPGAARP